jgi:hypothetical protein
MLAAALAAMLCADPDTSHAQEATTSEWRSSDRMRWPEGTEVLPALNLEGVTLVEGRMYGPSQQDSSGLFALDTGAGYLALDLDLARRFGLADSADTPAAVGLTSHPLPRFTLGALEMNDVEPVLTIDGAIIRRVTDRPVLGLLGQKPLSDRAIWIDYREGVVALIPIAAPANERSESVLEASRRAVERSRTALRSVMTPQAIAVPFRLAGDGKVLVSARVSNPKPGRFSRWFTLIVDTGASKTVFFQPGLKRRASRASDWTTLRGLSAPTLVGTAEASLVRVPAIEVRTEKGTIRVERMDAALVESGLADLLSRVTQEEITGLLGYSWLKYFRVVFDYPNEVLWLDAIPDYVDDRPLEYSHVGLQLERSDGEVIVSGVAEGSPAALAGIQRGDRLIGVDGENVEDFDLTSLGQRMEGPPGSSIEVVTRRGSQMRTHRLVRRQLL